MIRFNAQHVKILLLPEEMALNGEEAIAGDGALADGAYYL